jgi:ABC-type amino acid transport substrate-binding protein
MLVLLLSSAGLARAADLPAVKARGTLRVLACARVEPYFFAHAGGDRPGMDREILESFAQAQQVRLEVVSVPAWGELVPALLAERGDVIAGSFSDTPERRRQIAFTAEVFPSRTVVMTRAPRGPVRTLAELRTERVAATPGTSEHQELQSAGILAAEIVVLPTETSPATALREELATAVAVDLEDAVLAARADPTLRLGMYLGPPGSQAYGVRPQDVELRRALDAHIALLRGSPKWSQLVLKYLGEEALGILRKARAAE